MSSGEGVWAEKGYVLGKREYPDPLLQMPVPVSLPCPRLILLLETPPCPACGTTGSLTNSRFMNPLQMPSMMSNQDKDVPSDMT